MVYPDGRGKTWLETPDDMPEVCRIDDPEVLVMELQLSAIDGVPGYRLVEEKTCSDGSIEVVQEYNLAPDIIYSLFLALKKIDDEVFGDD